jgi:N-acetyl-gamma-glutamyl-phosphate reductase
MANEVAGELGGKASGGSAASGVRKVRTGIVGGSGYAGAELLRLLAGHPGLDVAWVTGDSNAGREVAELYPSLGRAYPGLRFEPFEAGRADDVDVVWFALPHGESQRLVPKVVDQVAHVVDLAAVPARVVVEPTGIVVNGMSGVSGRGRGLTAPSLFSEADENVNAYGLVTHRHTGEMERELSALGPEPVQVLFNPHLVPMTRGILTTCTARTASAGLTTEAVLEAARDFYADAPFVAVLDDPPRTKAVMGSNEVHLTYRVDDRTGTTIAIGAIDNLVKGTAGQAIQALNLALGLPEATGLPTIGLMP